MALAEQFLEGNRRRYVATFRVPDATGTLTDPTTVFFYRRRIDGTSNRESWEYLTDVEVERDSVGVFHIDLSFPDDGRFTVGAEGTGTCEAYAEVDIVVQNAKARP